MVTIVVRDGGRTSTSSSSRGRGGVRENMVYNYQPGIIF